MENILEMLYNLPHGRIHRQDSAFVRTARIYIFAFLHGLRKQNKSEEKNGHHLAESVDFCDCI